MSDILALIDGYPVLSWAALGVALLAAEILLAPGFFLSFAAGAFVVALGSLMGLLPIDLLWKVLIFAVIGVVTIPVFRNVLRKYVDRTPDINKY